MSGHSHSHFPSPAPGERHGHARDRAGSRHKGRLAAAFALTLVLFGAELVTAVATDSLALLSDAGHMLTDLIGLGMALAAIHLADRGSDRSHRTFGLYRLEILAALANTVLLFGVAAYVLVEAGLRLGDPPEIRAGPVLVVAGAGLVVNLGSFALLRAGAAESLNVRGASLEVLADALGSVGVLVAATVTALTGWPYADPLAAAAIGVFIVPRAWRLGGQALRILVQAAPAEVDLAALAADLAAVPGVVDVHDLHVWTLTSDMEVATAHVMIGRGTDAHGVLDQARDLLAERHGISHATLQVEPEDHTGCDEVDW